MIKPKTREELFERLESWAACYDAEIGFEKDDEQAQKQIIEIIQNQSEVPEVVVTYHSGEKVGYKVQPEVDENFVEMWTGVLLHRKSYGQINNDIKQMFKEAGYKVIKKSEITLKDIEGWADEIRERVTNHDSWCYAADTIKDMVEEEFGIKVKK